MTDVKYNRKNNRKGKVLCPALLYKYFTKPKGALYSQIKLRIRSEKELNPDLKYSFFFCTTMF